MNNIIKIIGRKRRIDRICAVCEKSFEVIPSAIKYGRGKTCSRKCQYILIGRKAKERRPIKYYEKCCKYCNKGFRSQDKRQIFCCRDCWFLWNCGENHFNYKDGLGNYPHPLEFNEKLKEQIRERDNYQCRICGEINNYRKMPIHHIDYDKSNNNPDNLITLCDKCHVKTNYNRNNWLNYFLNKPYQLTIGG